MYEREREREREERERARETERERRERGTVGRERERPLGIIQALQTRSYWCKPCGMDTQHDGCDLQSSVRLSFKRPTYGPRFQDNTQQSLVGRQRLTRNTSGIQVQQQAHILWS